MLEENEQNEEKLVDKKDKNDDRKKSYVTTKSERLKKEELKERKKLIAIFVLIGLIIISIMIFIFVFDFFPDLTKIEIECTYYSPGGKVNIFNPNYTPDSLEVIINEQKIENISNYNNNFDKGDFKVIINLLGDSLVMKNMFKSTNIKNVKIKSKQAAHILDMDYCFNNCKYLEEFSIEINQTENITSLNYLFYNSTNLKKVDLSSINAKNIKTMNYSFANTNISKIDLKNFEIKTILDSEGIFENCSSTVIIKKVENNDNIKNQLEKLYPNITFEFSE